MCRLQIWGGYRFPLGAQPVGPFCPESHLDLMQIPVELSSSRPWFHAIFNCRDDISPIQKGSVNPAAAVGHWNIGEMIILVLSMASMVSDRLRCLILSLILIWNTWIFNFEIMKILKHKDLVIKDKPSGRAMKVYGNLTRPSDWLYCAWDTLLNDEP